MPRWILILLLLNTCTFAQVASYVDGMRVQLILNNTIYLDGDRVLLKVKISTSMPMQLIENGSALTLTRIDEDREKILLKTNITFHKLLSQQETKAWAWCGTNNGRERSLSKNEVQISEWTKKGFLVLNAPDSVGFSKYLDEFSFYSTEEETFYKSKPDVDSAIHNILRPGHYKFSITLVTGKKKRIHKNNISFIVRK